MNQIISKEVKMTSIELADITGKRHDNVLADVRKEIDSLGDEGLLIFKESSYRNSQNKEQPCYEFGRDGAMQLALKYDAITRRKVILKLEELEKMQMPIQYQEMSPQLQFMINIEIEQKRQAREILEAKEQGKITLEKVESIKEVISLDTTSWREDTGNLLRKISIEQGGGQAFSQIRTESYDLLNKRMGVDLKARLTNKRRRMADEGICKSGRDKLTYVDVIADDKKLIEGYTAIVKEMSIKYGVV